MNKKCSRGGGKVLKSRSLDPSNYTIYVFLFYYTVLIICLLNSRILLSESSFRYFLFWHILKYRWIRIQLIRIRQVKGAGSESLVKSIEFVSDSSSREIALPQFVASLSFISICLFVCLYLFVCEFIYQSTSTYKEEYFG